MTEIDDLIRLCRPPATSPTADWHQVERTLGFTLPADYRHLATAYGPGSFCDFLSLRHPLGATDWISLTGPMTTTVQQQLTRDQDRGQALPCPPADLFPIAVSDNGEYVFWHTTSAQAPNMWTIAVNEARGLNWFTYDGSLAAFLLTVFSGRLQVPLFPDSLLAQGASFTPAPPPGPGQASARVTTAASGAMDSHVIRAWAREHGYDVPERGRIPGSVISAWKEANPS
ncbi:Lsr2 family DNA-binding protein [Streptomyces longispororuber]|uniref:Lsr2 family DNA-binding protein n=1 Tax=Streptomyces longispororuber TaxID=68230 RepID=UPI00210EC57E|nr:histone-like nucleoid-structuring protein Lsr2 [Streptomyces longispororuber]MCQ4212589.1 Lsr2 family protein [Streptomyces longispororuber]